MSKATPVLYEFIWWAFTLIFAGLVLLPIYTQLPDFEHLLPNFFYIVAAITLTRYLFFLDITWLRDHLLVQGAISILLLPLIFAMIQYLNSFILFFDEQGPDVLIQHLDKNTGDMMNSYLKAEYRFFSIWAITAAIVMPLRLLYNVWKRYGAGVRKL